MVVSLGGPPGGLARRTLDEPRRQATRGQRARRRVADPFACEVASRCQRERKRPVCDPEADRKLRDQGDARTRPCAPEPAPASERHPPRDRDERRRIGREEPGEHAPPELPLLGPDRQRGRELVQSGPGGGGREPVEIVGQAGLKRRAHPGHEGVRMEPLEGAWPVLARDPRESRHRLPPGRSPLRAGQVVQLEEAARVERGVSHADRSVAARSPGGKLRGRTPRCQSRRAVLFGSPSSAMIVLSNVTKRYGAKILFENVTVQFDPGKRYGVTGANGAGKSTLLEMLAKQEDWDHGSIDIPPALKIGVLEQNHFTYDQQRILDTVMAGKAELWAAMAEKEKLLAGEVDDAIGVRLGELEGVIAEHDGYIGRGRGGRAARGPRHPRREAPRRRCDRCRPATSSAS